MELVFLVANSMYSISPRWTKGVSVMDATFLAALALGGLAKLVLVKLRASKQNKVRSRVIYYLQ